MFTCQTPRYQLEATERWHRMQDRLNADAHADARSHSPLDQGATFTPSSSSSDVDTATSPSASTPTSTKPSAPPSN